MIVPLVYKDILETVKKGYGSPIIINQNGSPYLKMEKSNSDYKTRLIETLYLLKEYKYLKKSKCCKALVRFTTSAIKYLYGLLKKNKEVSGSLYFYGAIYTNDNIMWKIGHKPDTEIIGGETDVFVPETKITFHTHPLVTYEKYNVSTGYPSREDYGYCLDLFHNETIIHCVISKEGIYILTLKEKCFDMSKKNIRLDIEKRLSKFFIIGNTYSIEEYLKAMEDSCFIVKLVSWKDLKDLKYLPISFPSKDGLNCIVTEVEIL